MCSVLGHEAVVEVVDHRRPSSGLQIGDRLTFSVADSCGQCEFCQKGLNQKCVKLFKVREYCEGDTVGKNNPHSSSVWTCKIEWWIRIQWVLCHTYYSSEWNSCCQNSRYYPGSMCSTDQLLISDSDVRFGICAEVEKWTRAGSGRYRSCVNSIRSHLSSAIRYRNFALRRMMEDVPNDRKWSSKSLANSSARTTREWKRKCDTNIINWSLQSLEKLIFYDDYSMKCSISSYNEKIKATCLPASRNPLKRAPIVMSKDFSLSLVAWCKSMTNGSFVFRIIDPSNSSSRFWSSRLKRVDVRLSNAFIPIASSYPIE